MGRSLSTTTIAALLAVTSFGPSMRAAQETRAQEQAKAKAIYRLEFSVHESQDGKRLNTRTYMTHVEEDQWARLRVGSRIPLNAGEKGITYFDVGINIDCRPRERENYVLLATTLEISGVVEERPMGSGISNPVLRHARSELSAAVTPGKPSVITTLDEVASQRRFEIEVLVTKVR